MIIHVKEVPFLVRIAFARIKNDKDVTIAIVGDKGLGKSTLMIRLGIYAAAYRKYVERYGTLKVDPEKLVKIPVDFEEEVLKYINWIPHKWMESMIEAPRYAVVGLDEAGNAWANRRFNEEVNKMLVETQQSNRFLGQIKVLTMPYLSDIDAGGRKNCNFYINVIKKGVGKVYYLTGDKYTGKQYRYAVRYKGRDYIMNFRPLPQEIYSIYEEKKRSTEIQRYLDRIERMKEIEEEKSTSKQFRKAVEIALALLEEEPDKILTKRGTLRARYLAAKAKVSDSIAYKIKHLYDSDGIEGLREALAT